MKKKKQFGSREEAIESVLRSPAFRQGLRDMQTPEDIERNGNIVRICFDDPTDKPPTIVEVDLSEDHKPPTIVGVLSNDCKMSVALPEPILDEMEKERIDNAYEESGVIKNIVENGTPADLKKCFWGRITPIQSMSLEDQFLAYQFLTLVFWSYLMSEMVAKDSGGDE